MAGQQRITADGVLGTSGKPQRVYSLTIMGKLTGPGVVILRNGTLVTDTETFRAQGVSEGTTTTSFGTCGRFFPAGCFVDVDGDVEYAEFDYEQVQST